jgi:hypothetical protein
VRNGSIFGGRPLGEIDGWKFVGLNDEVIACGDFLKIELPTPNGQIYTEDDLLFK